MSFATLEFRKVKTEDKADMRGLALLITYLVFWSPNAHAKTFMNAYVSFDLSDRWQCVLEQTEWVCRTNEPGEAQAIIILAAKETGPQDSLPAYDQYLHRPKMIKSRTGQPLQSTVYQVEQQKINLQPWINGFHFDSEIVNYYTRYLATIKNGISILVTFSAHRNYYTKYSADFFRAIESLNVVVTKTARKASNRDDGLELGTNGGSIDSNFTGDSVLPTEDDDAGSRNHGNSMKIFLGLGLIAFAVGVLLLRSGRSGRGGRRR